MKLMWHLSLLHLHAHLKNFQRKFITFPSATTYIEPNLIRNRTRTRTSTIITKAYDRELCTSIFLRSPSYFFSEVIKNLVHFRKKTYQSQCPLNVPLESSIFEMELKTSMNNDLNKQIYAPQYEEGMKPTG